MRAAVLRPSPLRVVLIVGLALALVLAALWLTGALEALRPWLLDQQRAVQGQLAGAVRQVRAGAPGAWAALMAVCFGYGVAHAAGPGHGKLVISGYGVARRVPLGRLAGLAMLAALAQSAVAVALVGAGVLLLGWSRARLEMVNETWMVPLGSLAIAGVGVWLMLRGLRSLWRGQTPLHDHHHHHDATCSHDHAPTLSQVEALGGWRDAALLVGGIALRPCTGALFLLVLAFAMGIGGAGIAGTFAMGLGTGAVTVAAAALSVWAREGLWASVQTRHWSRALPVVEVLAGGVIVAMALALVWQAP